MPSICHYPGNLVDDLVTMAQAKHLFGPDRCGDRKVVWADVLTAFRVGPITVAQQYVQEGCNPRGAHYELVRAEYDEATDRTTAYFRPHINPLDPVRYYGGKYEQLEVVPTHKLGKRDKIRAR